MAGVRAALALLLVTTPASAGPAEWLLTEVERKGPGGDTEIRFVELHTAAGGCWFPTTQVAVYDAGGTVVDAVAPFASTTCFPADTFVLLATTGAEAEYGVTATTNQVPTIPNTVRQVCLRSTGTVYDCVRWGGQTVVIHDLFGTDDDSSAASPPPGYALARIGDSNVVSDDWVVAEPTPAATNDGEPWTGSPDAGVAPPDAGPPPDAAIPPDANAMPDAGPDARSDQFLDLDPGGGAGCGCASGDAPASWGGVVLLLFTAFRTSSAARRSRDRGPRAAPTGRSSRRPR